MKISKLVASANIKIGKYLVTKIQIRRKQGEADVISFVLDQAPGALQNMPPDFRVKTTARYAGLWLYHMFKIELRTSGKGAAVEVIDEND